MKIVGAIDVGSNAIRMVCARLTADRRIELIEKNRTPVRLGEDVFGQGFLSEETIQRLVDALKVYQKTLEQNGASEICAYCTSAIRETANQDEVIELLEQETGIRLETISGGKEASLLQRAVGRMVPVEEGNVLMADLGGGSLEISLLTNGEIQFAESFRVGTVRMLKMFPYTAEQEKVFLRWAKSYLAEFMTYIKSRTKLRSLNRLIITGGNATALAKLSAEQLQGPLFQDGVCVLDRSAFQKVKKHIFKHDLKGRQEVLGMNPDRADVILPAVLVFESLLRVSGCAALHIPTAGLRDGILDEMLERVVGAGATNVHEQILHSAWYYARKYNADMDHAETVRRLGLQLFDGTQALHQLSPRCRTLFEVAAILHDVGRFIRPSDHPHHSMYLIQNSELVGLTNTERQMVALISRYHASGTPSTKQREYARLNLQQRQSIRSLTALLRVADALDRGHDSHVQELSAAVTETDAHLYLSGNSDLMLAEWALQRKKKFFEKVFRRSLSLQPAAS